MQISSSSRGIYKTTEILQEFQDYYSSLYSIQGKYKYLPREDKLSKINDYLMKTNKLPSIPPNISADLETFSEQVAPLFLEVFFSDLYGQLSQPLNIHNSTRQSCPLYLTPLHPFYGTFSSCP